MSLFRARCGVCLRYDGYVSMALCARRRPPFANVPRPGLYPGASKPGLQPFRRRI